ncbi:cobalamin biosynthesis protein [Ruegeria sp. 2205SS24-7]|uniref:cobalamin biosynthesis protein n=1 Tax=Ruegeria discodermiae TaxID=3064389 RepID=UPI0027415D0D|nr:cobalamin biosynthesis protein [Ruegeria sp. 2205SS24-7]MDP5216909.1 cobalamin biosynthesis protein [Ruegeria sp. 2205SS24-7]
MIVAGIGFASAATAESLHDVYQRAAQDHFVTALATADDKAAHPALTALAADLHLPVLRVEADALSATRTLTQSQRSATERGTGSVAEAAALAAAGPDARLIAPRHISTDRLATCAVAIGGQT